MSKKEKNQSGTYKQSSRFIRGIWFTAGTICLILGAIGIVLPILPTTPFLLASAACYYKSSSRMHQWLINNKWFGDYIKNYQEGRGIPKKTKITALTILWITIGISVIFFLNQLLPDFLVIPMQITMIIVAIIVTIYMLRLPTFERK
jgi:uncharacterized membrane protein YbaN (DUF454 family)